MKYMLCLLLFISSAAYAEGPLEWTNLPNLPDKHGLGGPIVGTQGKALIVCGGANFPAGPPWAVGDQEPGQKVWHDQIYVLLPGANDWISAGTLPRPLAYAPTISTQEGVYVLGGESHDGANHPTETVLLLKWDAKAKRVVVTENALPPLPLPCQYHNAAKIGKVIYVAASHAKDEASRSLDEKAFWSLDLAKPESERSWTTLEPWPGAPREKMAMAVQTSGADDRYVTPECLYLFGGASWIKDAEGDPDLSKFEFYTDAYRYNPKSGDWKQISDLPVVPEHRTSNSREINLDGYQFDTTRGRWNRLEASEAQPSVDVNEIFKDKPRPAAAASAIGVGQSHILLFSGDTGRYITIDLVDRSLFPRDVLSYHTITDTWTVAGEMPLGVVTTGIAKWNDQIVIPSGEIRPGVRTNKVQALSLLPRKTNFGAINFIVLGAYLALLVGIGFYFSKGEKGTDDYFLAGKRIPWWAAGISIYATQLSAITFVALPAVAYASNWVVYPGQLTIFFFAPIVIYFYLPFFRRLNVTTAYEYLEKRFSLAVRLFGSFSFIVYQFGRMAVVVYLPALALSTVTGLNIQMCILVMGVLSTLYTVLGGMEAVIWTDVVQAFVLMGGMLLSVALIVIDVGGVGAVYDVANADGKMTTFNWSWDTVQMATWLIVLGNFALQFAPYTTDQAVVQRYMTTKDEHAAARSIWLNGLLTIPFGLMFFVLGTCLYVFFKSHPTLMGVGMENDSAFPLFMAEQLPAGLSGLVIAGVFAASMSSLDSSMHSMATVVTTDFYRRLKTGVTDHHCLQVARVLTVLIGAAGTGMALVLAGFEINSLFFFFQKVIGLIGSGLVGMFILGMFTRRANATGALTGALASFCLLTYIVFFTSVNFYLYAVIGIGVAVGVGYLVSVITPRPSHDLIGLTLRTIKK